VKQHTRHVQLDLEPPKHLTVLFIELDLPSLVVAACNHASSHC